VIVFAVVGIAGSYDSVAQYIEAIYGSRAHAEEHAEELGKGAFVQAYDVLAAREPE
jgi:hypothetical protein